MRRLRFLTALVAVLALAVTSTALANSPFTKVKGGTTTLTLNSAAITALTNAHLTVTPLAPASANASGSTFSFPISGGRINLKTLHGFIAHRGGITVSNGTKSGTVRHLTILANGKTAGLYGATRRSVREHCHVSGRRHHDRLV